MFTRNEKSTDPRTMDDMIYDKNLTEIALAK